jgi:hypothetical protein
MAPFAPGRLNGEVKMPLGQLLLFKVPTFLLGLIVIGGFVGLSVAGLLIVRHLVPPARLQAHHDVAAPILGILGGMYAVLLAFTVVTVWQGFERSSADVQMEANHLSGLYWDLEAFAPDFQREARSLLREYKRAVVDEEWKAMARGRLSPAVDKTLLQLRALYVAYEPRGLKEQSFFTESVGELSLLREMRSQRLKDARTGIHPFLYCVLVLGAVVTVAFTFLFGTVSLKAQVIMVILLSTMIAMILFTVLVLDFPFTGSISIPPEPFQWLAWD